MSVKLSFRTPGSVWETKSVNMFGGKTSKVYTLFTNKIQITEGLLVKKTKSIELYRIASKEIEMNIIGRIFNTGKINITTRGKDTPNVVLSVKDPQKVVEIIEAVARRDASDYKRSSFQRR